MKKHLLQGDGLHPVEGVLDVVVLIAAQRHQQPVCHKLDVLGHELFVHADQVDRQGLAHELLLYVHPLYHNLGQALRVQLIVQVPAQDEVVVQSVLTWQIIPISNAYAQWITTIQDMLVTARAD